jgi:hypothetical protein
MTDKDVETLNYNLLIDIENLFKEHYGKEYLTKLAKTDIIYTLSTPDFILTYSVSNAQFFLTFMVGQTGRKVAEIVKLIMLVLDYTEIMLMDDSYFDDVANQLVFGDVAVDVRHRDLLTQSGKFKCPMCNRIFENSYLTANGTCKVCESLKHKIVWN